MLILHHVKDIGYTVYIGSNGNKYIFNIIPENEPVSHGGYPNLLYICKVKGLKPKDIQNIVIKAEQIMGRTVAENLAIACEK